MTANTKGLRLDHFSRVVFFTGAGMSAESGVPTYRGNGGVWDAYDWESCACQRAFDHDPERVWDFHDMRRQMTAACEPHAGHRLITELESAAPNTVVVTQNIDGMHQKAGSHTVHELHGSLWRVRCSGCGAIEDNHEVPLSSRRHSCGAYWRPDIVWFEDSLRLPTIAKAIAAIEACDLLVSIGTSAVVFPAAELPLVAARAGATLVEINPEDTPLSEVYHHCLRMTASEGLKRLADDL